MALKSTNIDVNLPSDKMKKKISKEDVKLYGELGLAGVGIAGLIASIYYIGKIGVSLMQQSATDVKDQEYDRPFDIKGHKSDFIKLGISLAVGIGVSIYIKKQMDK